MAMEDAQGTDRQTWGNPVEFLMSCIAMSVGLGNYNKCNHLILKRNDEN
jgi:hypothetical protein